MYYSRRRPMEDHPVEPTAVWVCAKEGCNGWMRDEYAFDDAPACAQCGTMLTRGIRSLPVLLDSTYDRKAAVKKILEKG